jgi:hypothetical protein
MPRLRLVLIPAPKPIDCVDGNAYANGGEKTRPATRVSATRLSRCAAIHAATGIRHLPCSGGRKWCAPAGRGSDESVDRKRVPVYDFIG